MSPSAKSAALGEGLVCQSSRVAFGKATRGFLFLAPCSL